MLVFNISQYPSSIQWIGYSPENQRFSFHAATTLPRQGLVVADNGNGVDCGEKVGVFIATGGDFRPMWGYRTVAERVRV